MIKKSFKEATLFITNKLYLFAKTPVKINKLTVSRSFNI